MIQEPLALLTPSQSNPIQSNLNPISTRALDEATSDRREWQCGLATSHCTMDCVQLDSRPRVRR